MNLLSLGAGIDITSVCDKMSSVVQIVGYILLIIKIAMPLVIIFYGILDFGKAVIAEKEDDIKKYAKRLIFRIIAGIAIFLIPNIILWIFTLNKDYETAREQASFEKCEECFIKPWSCDVHE